MIYLDNAATTQVHPRVIEAMRPYWTASFGNPSSLHAAGRAARKAVEDAREGIADLIGAEPKQVFFTGSATEADHLAIVGTARARRSRGNHIVTCAAEHPAVLKACAALEREGFQITVLPVDASGLVRVADVENALRPETILISIMMANNEVGTIEPVQEIAALARDRGVAIHTDAVQAIGKIRINVKELGIDLLAIAGHKIHAPKGIGALFVKDRKQIQAVMVGGGQEFERRAGTENVPYIAGLAEAMKLVHEDMDAKTARMKWLADRLWKGISDTIPEVRLNGHPTLRLPNILNVSIARARGDAILLRLDAEEICVSSGSACSSESMEISHVLLAMGLGREWAHGSIRFSLCADTTEEEIDTVLRRLPALIRQLRDLKPFSPQPAPAGQEQR